MEMKKNSYPGLFIAFEGLDGSGSSTQVDLLTSKLRDTGFDAFATKEPTNNVIGGLIRGQLTRDWKSSMECLQLLFSADRAHHLYREIIPALKQGKVVSSDRYFFSTIAFGSLELDREWLLALNSKFILPDIIFLIKVSPSECVRRMNASRFELELFEESKKLQKVWRVYDWLAKNFPNVVVVDGTRSRTQISEEIFLIVKKYLKKKDVEPSRKLI